MAVPHALLDANVLIPAGIRDVILRAAEKGLCRVRWSDDILTEVARHLPDFIAVSSMSPDKAQEERQAKTARAVAAMRHAFPDARVTNYQRHIEQMTNHADDRHVVAAAWEAGAAWIVTINVRHFPRRSLAPFNLRAVDPDAFLMRLFGTDPEAMATIIRDMERDLTRPPRTAAQLCDGLARIAPRFAGAMRGYMNV